MIEKEKNYYSVKEMETPVSLTENLNARQTLHLLFERQARYKKALAFLEEDDFVEHSFLVKRDENDEEQTNYSEMGAVDLFKLCKKRGIKVEPKQKASVYIKALESADKAEAEADGDEDWDDEEEAKPAKKTSKKPAKKTDDDDDDSWDI